MICRIKWENIMVIAIVLTTIMNWIVFIIQSNIYTLALAVLPTFVMVIVIMSYDTIKQLREQLYK